MILEKSRAEAIADYCESYGITEQEAFSIVASVIENIYRNRNQIVQVNIDREGDDITVHAVQYLPFYDFHDQWRKLDTVYHPDATDISLAIDDYLTKHAGWKVDWFDVEEVVSDSFFTLRHHSGFRVVLPFSKTGGAYTGVLPENPGKGFHSYIDTSIYLPAIGDTIFAAYHAITKSSFRGGEEKYYSLGVDYIASRVDSIFLRLSLHKLITLPSSIPQEMSRKIRSEIYNGTGTIIVPTNLPTTGLIGPGGANFRLLRYVTGLRRLSMVYDPPSEYPPHRSIRFAIKQISGVKAKVSAEPLSRYGITYYPVRVSHSDYAKAIGPGGCNAVLAQRLCKQNFFIEPA